MVSALFSESSSRRFLTWCADRTLLSAAPDLTNDERLAYTMRQLLDRYGDLHVIVTEYVGALADADRTPATIERALAAIAVAHQAAGAGIRDTALLVLGFALGARRSELSALDIADLSFTAKGVQIEVRTSKTGRDSRGRRRGSAQGRAVARGCWRTQRHP